ncbi:MAG TPA: type II toxin-antitoxin system PemK/MazF family toxin [Candidatus Obscuribacterales bacterium]
MGRFIARRGEIWLINVMGKTRPALVISHDGINATDGAVVIPASSLFHSEQEDLIVLTEADGVSEYCYLVVEKLSFVRYFRKEKDQKPFIKRLGAATPETMRKVEFQLTALFQLKPAEEVL